MGRHFVESQEPREGNVVLLGNLERGIPLLDPVGPGVSIFGCRAAGFSDLQHLTDVEVGAGEFVQFLDFDGRGIIALGEVPEGVAPSHHMGGGPRGVSGGGVAFANPIPPCTGILSRVPVTI